MTEYYGMRHPCYQLRENVKEDAWIKIRNSTCAKEKAHCFIRSICWAHYWRAKEDIERLKDKQACLKKIMGKKYCSFYSLDIDHYTPHWMHANRKHLDDDVMQAIKELWGYDPEESKYLPEGYTQYQV